MPVEVAEHERPDAVGIAEGEQRVLAQHDRRERAADALHRVHRALGERAGVVRDERADDLGVGGRAEPHALLHAAPRAARWCSSGCRCGRARRCGPGGAPRSAASSSSAPSRWSSSAHARSPRGPGGACSLPSSKTCATRPMSLHGGHAPAVGDGDAGALLPAVLQRVEREVGQAGDVAAGRVDAEDAAHAAGRHRIRERVLVRLARVGRRQLERELAAAQRDRRAAQRADLSTRHTRSVARLGQGRLVLGRAARDDQAAALAEERHRVAAGAARSQPRGRCRRPAPARPGRRRGRRRRRRGPSAGRRPRARGRRADRTASAAQAGRPRGCARHSRRRRGPATPSRRTPAPARRAGTASRSRRPAPSGRRTRPARALRRSRRPASGGSACRRSRCRARRCPETTGRAEHLAGLRHARDRLAQRVGRARALRVAEVEAVRDRGRLARRCRRR